MSDPIMDSLVFFHQQLEKVMQCVSLHITPDGKFHDCIQSGPHLHHQCADCEVVW